MSEELMTDWIKMSLGFKKKVDIPEGVTVAQIRTEIIKSLYRALGLDVKFGEEDKDDIFNTLSKMEEYAGIDNEHIKDVDARMAHLYSYVFDERIKEDGDLPDSIKKYEVPKPKTDNEDKPMDGNN